MNIDFLFIGGDLRQLYAADYLRDKGYSVSLFGFAEKDNFSYNDIFSCVVLPAPLSRNSETVFAPFSDFEIPLSFLETLPPARLIVGGGLNSVKDYLNCGSFDLLTCDEYNILNAAATAEGAIAVAIKNTSFNIRGANVLVCGYGKIGKVLSSDLLGLGARVYVFARKKTDRALCINAGYVPVTADGLEALAGELDIVFNTVPHLIVKEAFIKNLKKGCLLEELASKPGGIDAAAAHMHGIKHIEALGLPGKYSPETSGKIIAQIILNSIGKENDNLCL